MINVEVTKNGNESAASLIRRFTRRMQDSGVLRRVRGIRYYERPLSEGLKKQRTLKTIQRREAREELAKLGKLPPSKRRGRR